LTQITRKTRIFLVYLTQNDNHKAPRKRKIKELMILRAIEPIKALQIPQRNRNPGTSQAAKPKIMAFKTNRNNPKVKIMRGNVKKPNMGRKRAFKTPKTKAEMAALPKLSISTPIGSLEIIKKLTVVTSQVMKIPVMGKTQSIT
jgi:hypothetical protein